MPGSSLLAILHRVCEIGTPHTIAKIALNVNTELRMQYFPLELK